MNRNLLLLVISFVVSFGGVCFGEFPLDDPALVAFWSFNAGNAADDSGNGHDGVIRNGSFDSFDAERGMVLRNTTGGHVYCGGERADAADPLTWADMTESFSISCWIKIPVAGFEKEWQAIFTKGTRAGGAMSLTCVGTDARIYFRARGLEIENDHIYGSEFVDDGEWHHLVATCAYDAGNGSSILRLFIDGEEDYYSPVVASSGSITASTDPILIAGSFGQSTVDGSLRIDDVYLFSKALSVSEIVALGSISVPGDLSGDSFRNFDDLSVMGKHWLESDYTIDASYGLVGHWDFAGTAGGTVVTDMIGDNDAVLDGSGGVDLAGGYFDADPCDPTWVDPNAQYIDFGADLGAAVNSGTSATFIIDIDWDGPASGSWQKVWSFANISNTRHEMLSFVSTNDKYLRFQHRYFSRDEQTNAGFTSSDMLLGRHQIAIVYNNDFGIGGYGQIFVDGVSQSFHSYVKAPPIGNSFGTTQVNNFIGRGPYNNAYLDARVYDFKIYNRALSADEISDIQNGKAYSIYVPLEAAGNFSDTEAANFKEISLDDLEAFFEQWLESIPDLSNN